jgi:hypothetical protein
MNKIKKAFVIGTAVAVAGLTLAVQAENLAMEWHGNSGSPNPSKMRSYETAGMIILGFGLLLNAMAICHWLWGPTDH